MSPPKLPVSDLFSELSNALEVGNAIVVAPPGAGKSTALPLHLLSLPSSSFAQKKIIMLQPRRIAARSVAQYLSKKLGEEVGNTVGYRIRGEQKVSLNTRLEIVTEGILTRMLQSSPELPDVSLIIFDEFHERSIHADFSLALSLEVQQALREDLRLLVMSATLDAQALKSLMPEAPVLCSQGRSYPVDIEYVTEQASLSTLQIKADAKKRNRSASITMVARVSQLIKNIFNKHQYDFLVFLPGAFEINKAALQLSQHFDSRVSICPLYSDLNKAQQQFALSPDPQGKRKIVLATNIAETSLTIDGIEVVIDSGLEKRAVFDLKRGISELKLQRISQASSTQRAGRAGRLMAGHCYRMWPKEQQSRMAQQSLPEILCSDISSITLESIVWGTEINELALLDYPTQAQISQAKQSMRDLGILNQGSKITPLGSQIHRFGSDIAIASMLLHSASLSQAHQSMACAMAAILENKDPLSGEKRLTNSKSDISIAPSTISITERLRFLMANKKHALWQHVRQWHHKLGLTLEHCEQSWPIEDGGLVLAFGFTQWIAKYQGKGRFLLANGNGAIMANSDSEVIEAKSEQVWLVVCRMQILQSNQSSQDNTLIRYGQELSFEQLKTHFASLFIEREEVEWDEQRQKITAREVVYFSQIKVSSSPLAKPANVNLTERWREVLEQKLGESSASNSSPLITLFDKRTQQLLIRNQLARDFCQKIKPETDLPDLCSAALIARMDEWLLPYLEGKTSWQALTQLPFFKLISQLLNYQQSKLLDELLPETLLIPTGRKANLRYQDNGQVMLSVRMQELYGLQEHPSVLEGNLAISCELLSPAQRPLQTTQDLGRFWSGSYQAIKKEMKGRYPKHFWPDDPANAIATAFTKNKTRP